MKQPVILFLLAFPAFSQQESIYGIHLSKAQVIRSVPGGPVLGQTACDDHGNVFYRQYVGSKLTQAPVVKLSEDGKKTLVFDFNTAIGKEDIKGLQVRDFALQGSKVYMLSTTLGPKAESKTRILTFSSDAGTLEGIVTLETDIVGSRLGLMPSGEFFVFGVRTSGLQDPLDPSSFVHTAVKQVFSPSGKLIADSDLSAKEADLNNRKASVGENLRFVDFSLIDSDQSSLYLLTYSEKPTLYSLRADAAVDRQLRLDPPESGMRPLSLRVNGPEVLVEYTKSTDSGSRSEFVTYSTETGERLKSYALADASSGIFACYNTNGNLRSSRPVKIKEQ